MPKIKNNQARVRKNRTPNADLLAKYERIALLSAICNQSEIVDKCACSYGTIKSAIDYFKMKNPDQSDTENLHEWTVVLGGTFRFQIRMVNWTNRHTTYDVITPDEFNQYLANQLSKKQNASIHFRLEYINYQFFDISIIPIEDLTAVFHALIWDSINPLLRNRYKETISLGIDNRSVVISPKEGFETSKEFKHTQTKLIATKEGLILL